MSNTSTQIFDFKRAVARQFADRPTLRQVVSRQLLQVLLTELPWLAFVEPALESADPLILDSPDPDSEYWTTASLVDVVLQAMLDGTPLDLEAIDGRHHNLGLAGLHRFPGSHNALDTRRLTGISPALNALPAAVIEHFCQAQVDYWREPGSSGKSRDSWFQLMLKMALLRNLPLHGLDDQQQACVRGLIRGGDDQPSVFVVEAKLTADGQQYPLMQPGLLLAGEWDEREVVLWCAPSSQVRAFAALDDFALALRDELALRYRFTAMTWDRHELEGNVFAQLSALLLGHMLEGIGQLRLQGLTLARLEDLFADLSDPAQWFVGGYFVEEDSSSAVPPGIGLASASDSFAYQSGLLDLALDQADAEGVAALDGVLDLRAYARQQLRKQMLEDYPVDANYFPDELVLELQVGKGMPGGAGIGSGGGEPLVPAGEMTLTEFAIANLGALGDATIKRIRHTHDQLVTSWMNAAYLKRLVQAVDIGGRYPAYVANALDDPASRSERTRRFAREWRQSLRFTALQAKLDRKITEAGLQCVLDLCKGSFDAATQSGGLIPLAFKRQQSSVRYDLVQGMYVLFSTAPSLVLLYRPLYQTDPLRQYADIDTMMAAIRTLDTLQQSILTWMDPDVRPVYDNGGFAEPHITHVGIDPYQLPERPGPVRFDAHLWLSDVDEKLYAANRAVLVTLADRQSTSNAEQRWATLGKGAWLLFDVATLLVRGPVATVAWLVQTLASLQGDGQALERGSEFEREAATVDLLVNLGMTLLHARLPRAEVAGTISTPDAKAFDGRPAQEGGHAAARVEPTQGKVGMPGPLAMPDGLAIDFSWRGNQGFNWLAPEQRKALMAMRASIVVEGLSPSSTGLYEIGGQQYVAMLGEVFAVQVAGEEVRVIGAARKKGPWLVFEQGAWRIDARLRLSGGMPRERLAQQFAKLQSRTDGLAETANVEMKEFHRLTREVIKAEERIRHLGGLKEEEARRRLEAEQIKDGTFDMASSDRIMASYEQRYAALDIEQDHLRLQAVAQAEQVVRLDREQCDILQSMLEPKYGSYRKAGFAQTLQLQRETLIAGLIRNSDFILSELQHLANFLRMTELAAQFDAGVGAQVRQQYRQFRAELAKVIEIQERMLVAQGALDELLAGVPDELNLGLGGIQWTVGQVVAKRSFTTIDLRFHHALNLADLALHLDGGQRQLFRYREDLAADTLRGAATAHGESLMSSLGVADRISILQQAWDAYAAAIVNAQHLERTGGALVEVDMLQRYRTHMQLLKDDAGRRLVDALCEQDGALTAPRRVPYPRAAVPQRALRNNDGLLVVATQVEGQAAWEVQDPLSKKALQVFELTDGEWHQREETAEVPPVEGEAEDIEGLLSSLLEDKQDVLAIAEAYVRDDVNGQAIERLLKRQIEKMQEAAAVLAEQGVSEVRTAPLSAAVTDFEVQRIRLLTELYGKTRYPTAQGLRFLHDQGLIKVDYVRRDTSIATSPFDEFRITRLNAPGATKGRSLWAAHFHLASQSAPLDAFIHGHLKVWSQRFMGRQYEAVSGERVHRGRLTAADVAGIIPLS
ncbi:hypothetical protein OC926_04270 [Pseudomonas peradeniyensis]|uniref:dermonecrotic toxin domain-containing protein n=1 Tax=Pseudomonas peradeniyensis TaxID=2745488 RepID=UPI0021D4D5BD|nr:DUF6543 domain-containing protein [Pseudomonas peradeniyensis]MCU7279046.1 hypothetical protein [Pseudomonas peradeniyensis]